MGGVVARLGVVYRTYSYRIYPTSTQLVALNAQLGFAADIYNAALEQRRYAWRASRPLGCARQFSQVAEIWSAGDGPPGMSYSAMLDPIRRLDRAFRRFERRMNDGQKPGFPRFRPRRRYDALTWNASWCLTLQRLSLPGIGHLKVKWHRALPLSGALRTVTLHRQFGHWYACFVLSLQISAGPDRPSRPPVGVDLGIKSFAALSTGELIPGPRAYRTSAERLRRAQRVVSRRVKGSVRRRKAGRLVGRLHTRIRNTRRNHAHHVSRRLVSEFGLIAVEDLVIHDLARGSFAKDARDQGWAQFLNLLGYKAADAGVQVVRVAPAGTSVMCSRCRTFLPKPFSERAHRCPDCGLAIDRDINAARNILRLGLSRQAST